MIVNMFGVLGIAISYRKNKDGYFALCCIVWLITISILGAYVVSSPEIPAIEVYRDNTTLQITYQDSIPIDSVVVYKNK